ncbi:hypothetical protein BH20ACT9_BH20ACT9_17210 [soil metagenome]
MARYLVVANVTLGGDHLLSMLRERVAGGDCHVHLLVPAAPDPASWRAHAHEDDAARARRRLARGLERFGELGCEVTGEVGDARPVDAVGDVLGREAPFDEIIVSTLPPGPSRWLRMDVPRRIERALGVAVTHVVAQPEPAG